MSIWIEPKTVECIGGPFDGETVKWIAGIELWMRDRTSGSMSVYHYEPHRKGDTITVRRAIFDRMVG